MGREKKECAILWTPPLTPFAQMDGLVPKGLGASTMHGRSPQPLWYQPVHLCKRSEWRCPQYRTLLFFPTHRGIIVPSNPSGKESPPGTLRGHLSNWKATLQVPFDPLSTWWKPGPFGANVSICTKRVSRGVHNIALSF